VRRGIEPSPESAGLTPAEVAERAALPTPHLALDAAIEWYADRWNKVGSHEEANQVTAEITRTAQGLTAEALLAYAAGSPARRAVLLGVFVLDRAKRKLEER